MSRGRHAPVVALVLFMAAAAGLIAIVVYGVAAQAIDALPQSSVDRKPAPAPRGYAGAGLAAMALSVSVAAAFLLGVAHSSGASQRVEVLLLAVLLTALAQALWRAR